MTQASGNREGGPYGAALLPRPGVAATALLGAAAIHAAEILPHGREWILAGAFFAGLGLVQGTLGLTLLSRTRPRWISLAVTGVSIGAAVAWTISRTVGFPFGPHAGVAEAVGTRDVLATALALVAVLALPRRSDSRMSSARPLPGLLRVGIAFGLVLAGTTGAFAEGETPPATCVGPKQAPIDYFDHSHEHEREETPTLPATCDHPH